MADVRPDSEEEEGIEFGEKLSQWRKGDVSFKKKKVRYIYKSVDDVLEQGKTTSSSKREYRYECVKMCILGFCILSHKNRPSQQLFEVFILYIFAATCFGPYWPSSGGIHNSFRNLTSLKMDPLFCVIRSRLLYMFGKYCRCLFNMCL
jgi:hypothetical protein